MENSNLRVLVIDDNPDIRDFLYRSVLQPEGYQILMADNGQKGLHLALEKRPDLILLDYELPGMNGIEVLRALKAEDVSLPTILITSYGSEAVAVEVFRLGVRDYVPKPFTVEEILTSMDGVLKTVRLEQQRDALMTKLQAMNEELGQRLRELNTLYHVSKSVAMLSEREQLIERIVAAAIYLTRAQEGALVLVDPHTGEPVMRVAKQRANSQGEKAPRSPLPKEDEEEKARQAMRAQLKIGERVLGTLTVSNQGTPHPLAPQSQQLLGMLADYAAISIQNNRLLAEVEARRKREKEQLRNLFEHYVAPPVVERILHQPQNIQPGGQRQNISVLFADLRGFTTFSAQTPPEELITVLNQHIATATEAILSKEGTLDKFMGDEVMAFFNAPLPQQHYALNAVKAAISILQATAELHKELPEKDRLDFGIGISTGGAIVGNVGTQTLVNFTVVGPTVNKAHSLQEIAPPGRILLCQTTYERVKDHITAAELAPVHIKGQPRPELIYEITVSEPD